MTLVEIQPMRLPLITSVLSLLLSLSLQAANPSLDLVLQMEASGSIDIGPDGTVVAHQLDRGLAPDVERLLADNIVSWRFEPILKDGVPVIASTRVNLSLKAVPINAKKMRLLIENVSFGSPTEGLGDRSAPTYPSRALRERIGAEVVLILRLDEGGKVVAAHPYQTSLDKRLRENQAARWRKVFEDASISTVMKWTYTLGESIGGTRVESTIIVPISYTISESRIPRGGWHGYVPGPVSPAPWIQESAVVNVDTSQLKDGSAQSLGSHFRLTSKVVGEYL